MPLMLDLQHAVRLVILPFRRSSFRPLSYSIPFFSPLEFLSKGREAQRLLSTRLSIWLRPS